jgi:hypothetical protein
LLRLSALANYAVAPIFLSSQQSTLALKSPRCGHAYGGTALSCQESRVRKIANA